MERTYTNFHWVGFCEKKIAKIGLEKVSALTFLKNRSHDVHSINLKIFGNIWLVIQVSSAELVIVIVGFKKKCDFSLVWRKSWWSSEDWLWFISVTKIKTYDQKRLREETAYLVYRSPSQFIIERSLGSHSNRNRDRSHEEHFLLVCPP